MTGRRYVLISPCRDEAKFAARCIESTLAQSCRPSRWIIVDDGSTDETAEILAEYADRHDFIQVVSRSNRGNRKVGAGVIEAFDHGLAQVTLSDFDYVCKLDLDLELPPRYFEMLLERFEADPRLGTCSGKPYYRGPNGDLISEHCGDEMSVGMTKLYRRQCFEEIGGFVREVMWDGIDCHRCRMLGWSARSWDDPDLRFLHLRPMGSSEKGIWEGRKRHGRGQYFMGTSLAFMTASAIYRMARRPFVIGGIGMWLGYFQSMVKHAPRYEDAEFRRFLRQYHRHCLLLGKARATRRLERRGESWWRHSAPESSDKRALPGAVA